MLSAARLRELLHYDPTTGVFTRRSNGRGAGYRAKTSVEIRVDHQLHRAHRLAWLYMTGAWPQNHIDHIDGDQFNNRFANLRDVTRTVNMQNRRRAQSNNRLGLQGVSAWGSRFKARLDGSKLGAFDTPEEAHAAYLDAKRRKHEGCTL
jgi:hypothetical protein